MLNASWCFPADTHTSQLRMTGRYTGESSKRNGKLHPVSFCFDRFISICPIIDLSYHAGPAAILRDAGLMIHHEVESALDEDSTVSSWLFRSVVNILIIYTLSPLHTRYEVQLSSSPLLLWISAISSGPCWSVSSTTTKVLSWSSLSISWTILVHPSSYSEPLIAS